MKTTLRVSMLGFAAGLLALLTFVALVYVALVVFAITFTLVDALAQARATGVTVEGSIWTLLGQSLSASGRNAVRGLWDLRGVFVVVGVVGIVAAWSYQVGVLVDSPRAWWFSFLGVAVWVVVAMITWLFVQREQVALWMAESPETYRWRDLLLGSEPAALTVAPVFALAIAYPTWAVWRWWYTRLVGRQISSADTALPSTGERGDAGDFRRYAERLSALKRRATTNGEHAPEPDTDRRVSPGASPLTALANNNRFLGLLALVLVGCFAGYLVTNRYQAQVALRLQHGSTFVDATTHPQEAVPLTIAADVRRLRIVNINGLGVVGLTLSPAANPTQIVDEVADWAFEWRADEYLYADISVQNLSPGDYILRIEQRTGWGYFEYMLSQGGGRTSQTLAVIAGLLLATGLVLAVAVATLATVRVMTA